MIIQKANMAVLHTAATTYAFQVTKTGHLNHLYYGAKTRVYDAEAFREKHCFSPGNTINYKEECPEFTLEDLCLEMSSYGKGDIREPFVEITHADGSYTSDFIFQKMEMLETKEEFATLPGSYDENNKVEHLCVTLKDASYDITLELHYYVYEAYDIISRSAKLINDSTEEITVDKIMSTQVDFLDADYVFTTFNGSWANEMNRRDTKIASGKLINSSVTGTSSNRANPFVMVSREKTTETEGECFGFNLIYSGNHYEAIEVSAYRKTRFVSGINPQFFAYKLMPGEELEAPEAVMTYSAKGFNQLSHNMHEFVRECIVRGEWKKKERPVLLNSWEANYFDISEESLTALAKKGKEVGIELFVMDDGWFGTRDNDTRGLGDWYVNKQKLPNGLSGLCDKINALGVAFGLWVEPEMVNVNSELYRTHPEWVLEIKGKPHSEGRHQRILDLSNPQVTDYIIEEMTKVFSAANIAYVKWDMNRIFSDYYSAYLPKDRMKELSHRYVVGLYKVMKELTKRFPHILFEGCCAGGNRFDLGILCYFPQIWGSDNTDAGCRIDIQNGYSYGYPASCVSAHVSACPNHQTMRVTPLETRFAVACFGMLGYECNLCEMSEEELAKIKEQIAFYKKWHSVILSGQFYRSRHGNLTEWTCVSKDKKRAIGLLMQKMMLPAVEFASYKAQGLKEDALYRFHGMEGLLAPKRETQDLTAYGETLMNHGVCLSQAFVGTGHSDDIRYFGDFASRLYVMEEI